MASATSTPSHINMDNPLAITAIVRAAQEAPLVLRGELPVCIRQAHSLGYDAVEIHVIEATTFPMEEVQSALQETGLKISAIVTGRIFTERGLCITSPNLDNRSAAMREMHDYIDIAAKLHATDGVILGWVKGNRRPEDPDFDRLLAEQLRILGEYAQSLGQTILIEVINRYETNLFTSVAELRDFLIQWNLPGCRIHLDTFHMNIEEADMVRAIEIAGDSLGYFHVADSNRLAPGRGHLDFSAMFAALERVGYHGTISLECIPQPDSLSTGAEGYLYLTKMLNNH